VWQVYARARHGADFLARHLFTSKTFVESRSMAAPFIAFWRVYNFHAVLFTVMAALVSVYTIAGWKQQSHQQLKSVSSQC